MKAMVLIALLLPLGIAFAIAMRLRKIRIALRKVELRARLAAARDAEWEVADQAIRVKEQKKTDSGKRVFHPNPGMAWNPLRAYPRNSACVCGSGKKFKICCLCKIPEAIPQGRVKAAQDVVDLANRGVDVPRAIEKRQAIDQG